MRRDPLTSLTPPALRNPDGLGRTRIYDRSPNVQLVAQRRVELELHLTPADVVVSILHPVERARRDGRVLGARIHRRGRLEELKEALHDHALKELDIACLLVREVGDLGARQGEEVLQVLLPAVQEPQSRFVCQRRLMAIARGKGSRPFG